MALNKIVPAAWNRDGSFKHTLEGDDDMPGHVKSSLMGASLNIPVKNGKLALGTWQVCIQPAAGSSNPCMRRDRNSIRASHTHTLTFFTHVFHTFFLQGIYLNEHRDQGGWGGGHSRNIVITLQGTS